MKEKVINFLKTVDLKSIKSSTYVYAIVVVLNVINYILGLFGYKMIPVNEAVILKLVIAIVMIYSTVQIWWRNNSITKPAMVADKILEAMKDGKITIEEVEEFAKEIEERENNKEGE